MGWLQSTKGSSAGATAGGRSSLSGYSSKLLVSVADFTCGLKGAGSSRPISWSQASVANLRSRGRAVPQPRPHWKFSCRPQFFPGKARRAEVWQFCEDDSQEKFKSIPLAILNVLHAVLEVSEALAQIGSQQLLHQHLEGAESKKCSASWGSMGSTAGYIFSVPRPPDGEAGPQSFKNFLA